MKRRPLALVTGATGQVGFELVRAISHLYDVAAPRSSELDLKDASAIKKLVRELAPDAIVNCAAYTAVDAAESDRQTCSAVNETAPRILAEMAEVIGAWIVHFSTDYIFSGEKRLPYTEIDEPSPLNHYGASKLAGERAVASACDRHLIFRTSWVYSSRGKNFVRTMLRLFAEKESLTIVDDQRGAPTSARFIAEAAVHALALAAKDEDLAGVYDLTCAGETTWYDFAREILRISGAECELKPIPTSRYLTPAKRPLYSVLSNKKLERAFGITQPDWQRCLALVMEELGY